LSREGSVLLGEPPRSVAELLLLPLLPLDELELGLVLLGAGMLLLIGVGGVT
jgi:hypothetical protein